MAEILSNTAKILGERMKKARKSKRLTQKLAAEILGVHPTTIARYENGSREPDMDTILKIAEMYDVSVNYLLTGLLPSYIQAHNYKQEDCISIECLQKLLSLEPIDFKAAVVEILNVRSSKTTMLPIEK